MLDLASETKADSQMGLYSAINWIFVSLAPPKLIYCNPNLQYELNWTSNMMILGGGPLGADKVMRVKLSWMGLAPLYKRPQRVPSSICSVKHREKMAVCDPRSSSSPKLYHWQPETILLDSRTADTHFCWYEPLTVWYFVTAAWADKHTLWNCPRRILFQ